MAGSISNLYRDDFYAWTREQAGALRRLAGTRPNVEVDWANLVEEVEDLGVSERNAVHSRLRRVMEHCLKLEHALATDPHRGWLNPIDDARAKIADRLTRSMRPDVEAKLEHLYRQVVRRVRRDLEAYGEADAVAALPETCPFSLDQILDDEWYPEPRRR